MPSSLTTAMIVDALVGATISAGVGAAVDVAMGSPDMPDTTIAPVTSMKRQDTGAQVSVGTQDIKNQRLSGTGTSSSTSTSSSTLGGLGSTGLSI